MRGPIATSRTTDRRGLLISETDALGNTTTYTYDGAGRKKSVTAPDPDGAGSLTSSVTQYGYDDAGNVTSVTNPLGKTTSYAYDKANRKISDTQPDPDGAGPLNSPVTAYTYDDAGHRATLTDPVGNTTTWYYDALGRVTGEVNYLNDARNFEYDGAGRQIRKTDRNSRVIEYAYNFFDKLIEETWLDGATIVRTLAFDYDDVGQLIEASDPSATYEYEYDGLGRVISYTEDIDGLSSLIEYVSQYNEDSSRTDLQAKLVSTNDFHNTYAYDNLQRLTSLTQDDVSGGNAVAEKRIEFTYNAVSQFTKIARHAVASGSELVANTFYGYDNMGRLLSLIHTTASSAPSSGFTGALAGYRYTYDAASRITAIDSMANGGLTSYSYDNTSQLTGADHPSGGPADESYSYDENGNRTMSGYETGSNNRLLSDGTYTYTYDNEGNRISRTKIATNEMTTYDWDYRNRLVAVKDRAPTYSSSAGQGTGWGWGDSSASSPVNGTTSQQGVDWGWGPSSDDNSAAVNQPCGGEGQDSCNDVTITAYVVSATEGDEVVLSLHVSCSQGCASTFDVEYALENVSAESEDYSGPTSWTTVTTHPASSEDLVFIATTSDYLIEGTESFRIHVRMAHSEINESWEESY